MRLIKSFVIALLLTLANLVQAGEGRQQLEQFLQNTNSLQADFNQQLIDPRGFALQESSGTFSLKRPGKFKWDYLLPYPQQIVSNGEKIWIYDAELEQVSIKKYDQVLSGAPVILLDQRKRLDEDFLVFEKGEKQGYHWLSLQPKTKESDFKEIKIAVSDQQLRIMQFVDNFDQTTIIKFKQLQQNPDLINTLFEFVPPAGTDVVGDY